MTKQYEVVFGELDEFTKEMKKLSKKYVSLEKDFDILKSTLVVNPVSHIPIEWIGEGVTGKFFKVKKFRCQSIAKNSVQSGIRIIYRYIEESCTVEFREIKFIEIYHKNQKTDFDRERVKKNFGV